MTRRSDAGIALLELMIALLAMAMMAVAIASILRTLGQGGQRIVAGQIQIELALSEDRVTRWAEGIPPELQVEGPLLSGTSDRLTFHTIDTSGLVWPGAPLRVSIGLEPDGLVAQLVGRKNAGATESAHMPILLAPGASNVTIRYWGANDFASAPDWSSSWDAAPRLPLLIRIDWRWLDGRAAVPIILEPALASRYNIRSLSSPVPPG